MLKEPLSQQQITTASRIRRQLPFWDAAEKGLTLLASRVPEFSLPETMVKVAAVNQLYGTNLYAVTRMAQHIAKVPRRELSNGGPILVERIACIPPVDGQRAWRHFSFASKFCHFFVNRETCPIFDGYAEDSLRRHLGRNRVRDPKHPYLSFVSNSKTLLQAANVTVSAVDLDSYLWLRGAFERWRAKPSADMNVELRAFFSNRTNKAQLVALVGER